MNQAQFDDLIGDLTPDALLQYGNGIPMLGVEPLMPEDLNRDWTDFGVKTVLGSLGSGRYFLHQPDNGGIVRTADGQPYEIDLKRFHKDGWSDTSVRTPVPSPRVRTPVPSPPEPSTGWSDTGVGLRVPSPPEPDSSP